MCIVSVAITVSFHVKSAPTEAELRMARPLGAVFWVLSVLMLALGVVNYIRTSTDPNPLIPQVLLLSRLTPVRRHRRQVQPAHGHCAERVEDADCRYSPHALGMMLTI